MNVYDDNDPADLEEHNRLMNEAVIKYRCPRLLICPDCYMPPRMCNHIHHPDFDAFFHRK